MTEEAHGDTQIAGAAQWVYGSWLAGWMIAAAVTLKKKVFALVEKNVIWHF